MDLVLSVILLVLFVSPEITHGEVRATATVYPVMRGFWDRLRAAPSDPSPRALGRRPLDGQIGSLRRFKDDVRDVAEGFECGIGLENYQDIKEGDVIETYEVREVPRSL